MLAFAVGVLQWDVIREQNRVMVEQNAVMREQNADTKRQADLALKATEQTGETLELMRLQQRPWLAIVAPDLRQPFVEGENLDITLPIHNFGSTPGTLSSLRARTYVVAAATPFDGIVKHFESEPSAVEYVSVLPQGNIHLNERERLQTMDKNMIDNVISGSAKIYVLCSFQYSDVWMKDHTYRACFYWDHKASSLILDGRYGRSDTYKPTD